MLESKKQLQHFLSQNENWTSKATFGNGFQENLCRFFQQEND